MPELPEVEVVKRSLERNILNLIIKKVKIKDANLRYKVDKIGLSKLIGKKITKIKRRSKFLIFEIGKTYQMLVHLGMTGKFRKTQNTYLLYKHDHFSIKMSDNSVFVYNDVRKFGSIHWSSDIDKHFLIQNIVS